MLLIATSLSYAQNNKNDNEIIVEGTSKTKIQPDIAIFTLTIEKTDSIEKKALEKLNKEVDGIVKSLYKIGFTKTAIKISDYNISKSRNEEDNNKKRYRASNILKLEFGLNTKLIDKVYEEVQLAGHEDLDISFETKISDGLEKSTRTSLVEQAIINAKDNASNISKALNLKLIGIKQVSKNQEVSFGRLAVADHIKFPPPMLKKDEEIAYATAFDKFEVEHIELEERITIVYRISN